MALVAAQAQSIDRHVHIICGERHIGGAGSQRIHSGDLAKPEILAYATIDFQQSLVARRRRHGRITLAELDHTTRVWIAGGDDCLHLGLDAIELDFTDSTNITGYQGSFSDDVILAESSAGLGLIIKSDLRATENVAGVEGQ